MRTPSTSTCQGDDSLKLENCHEGMRVKYIPIAARHDPDHPDCKVGTIDRVGGNFIRVLYDDGGYDMIPPGLLVSLSKGGQ